MEALKAYFNNVSKVGHHDWQAIEALAKVQKLRKGEILCGQGEKADKEVFIENGVVRAFIVDEEGNEKSTAFFQSPSFMSMTTLRSTNGLSNYSYQALCSTTIVMFQGRSLKALLSSTPQLISLGKAIKEKEMTRLSDRDNCLLQVKATDKYLKFLACYPKIETLISQRYIASYLGITPVSLSRLKKELALAAGVNN